MNTSQIHHQEEDANPSVQASGNGHSSSVKILLVGDDEGQLELLSFLVQRDGFTPIMANESSALQLLEEVRPTLLVLDTSLDDGEGLSVLQAVRGASDVPVIVLSWLTSEDDTERALDLGADDYIAKPFGFRVLMSRIRAVVRRTRHTYRTEPSTHAYAVNALRQTSGLDTHAQLRKATPCFSTAAIVAAA
jgi:DNA-binding response OmpR family regulator